MVCFGNMYVVVISRGILQPLRWFSGVSKMGGKKKKKKILGEAVV